MTFSFLVISKSAPSLTDIGTASAITIPKICRLVIVSLQSILGNREVKHDAAIGARGKKHAGTALEAKSVNNSVNVLKRPNTAPSRISKRWYGSLRNATYGSELAGPDIHT